ncbi:coil containing protein [Vibrio phage 1.188.A._10N.286.51.A6]|uniref:Coil containing protein n=4 Tax=Mukerjeevirus TaxID=2733146 RepID=A0A2I7REM9_9CAUD|nr:coil containing protein [Vibrio phage 1.169.O._10N.261.52.B1]YP_009817512.1 coil containing protein [Vibrio phage 1.188.A._10N.286.51.A6]AUR93707.1 coil containing protein [Vibrio phage 1.188.B._10N.286.51.A6]AUR93793.1 coil containing protein [Vibrio phage 1.188.C._10N.286.51.A6]AUR92094.1 coil containing protein [Vibrio phage 1.169.O._10N.261.52.B1]AUR93621.1 coil containing protein [Vibrio phage 1.188.A._10N.286.51.A6]
MTDFFSFTKVKAPDLSSSAELFRGAQKSVTAAANSLNQASNRINLATQNEDTRIRTDNTDQLIAQINQATTLEEVNQLQAYVGSEDFGTEYNHGFYIDAEKINNALLKRPDNIEAEQKIKTSIQSRDEGTSVQGYVSGVNAATTPQELERLRKDYLGRNYTAGNLGKLNKAYADRLAELEAKKARDLQNRVNTEALRKTQAIKGYESDLTKMTSEAMGKLGATDNLAKVDVDSSADKIARQLVEKYQGYVSYDDALVKATLQLNGWYNRFGTKAQLNAQGLLSEDQRYTFIGATQAIMAVDPKVRATEETAVVLEGAFPTTARVLKEPQVSASEQATLFKDTDSGVKTALGKLDPRMFTNTTLMKIAAMDSAGQAKTYIAQLNNQLAQYDEIEANLVKVRTQAATRYSIKRDKLTNGIADSTLRTATLTKQIEVAQNVGDADKATQLIEKLDAEHDKFESLTTQMTELSQSPTEAANLWKASPVGQRQFAKYIRTTANDHQLGTQVERIGLALGTAITSYGLPDDITMDVDVLVDAGVPTPVAKEMALQGKKLDEAKAREVKSKSKKAQQAKAIQASADGYYSPYQ